MRSPRRTPGCDPFGLSAERLYMLMKLPHLRVFENLQYRFSGCEKKRRQKNLVERFRSEGRDSLVRSLSPRGAHSLVPMRLEGKHAVGVCGSNKKQKLTGPYRGWGKRCPNDGLLLD